MSGVKSLSDARILIPVRLVFLLCLILITQGNAAIKLLGFSLLLFSWPTVIFNAKLNKASLFYLSMLMITLASSITLFFVWDRNYAFVVFLGFLFWLIPLLIFFYLQWFSKRTDSHWVLRSYFIINAAVSVLQIMFLAVEMRGNPFAAMSAGDMVMGIFSNSSVNMVVNSFFLIYFLYQRKYLFGFVAGVLILATTYMSGIVIMFGVIGLIIFFHSGIKLSLKVGAVLGSFLLISLLMVASPDNISYAKQILKSVTERNKPRKITSFEQTGEFLISSPEHFLFGAGIGNFSSRLTFSAGGEYADWYPQSLVHRSEDFENNHFELWNTKVLSLPYNDGTANQPFSLYNQILGEYGFLGMVLFSILYLGFFLKRARRGSYGRIIFLLLLGYLVLDYWYEYFCVMILFEFFILVDSETAFPTNQSPA